jgi:hypothetical protein
MRLSQSKRLKSIRGVQVVSTFVRFLSALRPPPPSIDTPTPGNTKSLLLLNLKRFGKGKKWGGENMILGMAFSEWKG